MRMPARVPDIVPAGRMRMSTNVVDILSEAAARAGGVLLVGLAFGVAAMIAAAGAGVGFAAFKIACEWGG